MIRPCGVLRPASGAEERTVVVLGMPRGGTSMVAGSLRLLGVPMGDRLEPSNQEDLDILDLVASLQPLYGGDGKPIVEKFDRLRALIASKNGERSFWGWKDPNAQVYINEMMPVLRNPHVILVFRDHFAAAQTIEARTGREVLPSLEQGLDQMRFLLNFVRAYDFPLLLVSYERALRLRESFARQLADFVGAEADEKKILEIVDYVRPDRGGGNLDAIYRATDRAFWRARQVKR
jgi:hypothetical protein